ncbi:putative ABC exporter domain-containing protein [Ruminococcus sp. OA3]|uniref:putative ABC exporter domain-containing protein n=1 Tax=Ruminococcus sp. OA3 TaxID=2914164 RepID=UPI001F063C80|nr:putative ABC exporter domain-containing protein [Ruminococcus sp. OA3]MCH1981763.1 putative ABC exporter domain-containing protein [Ruminococcus sp. OA3]
MNSLIYIVLKSTRNSLKELLKKPGKLIMYLFIIAMIAGVAVMSFFTEPGAKEQAPMFVFTGVLFAFITFFVGIGVSKGVSGGDQIFEMNDVNLLFVSPVSPRKILLYGILRLAKVAFFAGFFLLFQASTFAMFGIDFGGLLLVWICFMMDVVVLSIVSLLLYNVTNSRPHRKMAVRIIAVLMFVPLAAYMAVKMIETQEFPHALELAVRSPFMKLVPIAGWTAAGVTYLFQGQLLQGFLYLSANLVFGLCMIVYILMSRMDYYEDTLVATETVFEKKRAAASGNINEAQNTGKRINVSKTGISGSGAAALFGKHVRESFRQSRLGFLSFTSVIVVISAITVMYMTKELMMVLQILMWMQIFLIGTGRGLRETYTHYIYMIPESSFKKIVWSNMESVVKTLLESVLIFGIGGLLAGTGAVVILGSIVAYTLFSVLLLGVNYLSMRFTGANISSGLLIMIYCFAVMIIIAPGVAASVITAVAIGGTPGMALGFFVLSAWELIAGAVCFLLSKGVLDNCDLPVMKPRD